MDGSRPNSTRTGARHAGRRLTAQPHPSAACCRAATWSAPNPAMATQAGSFASITHSQIFEFDVCHVFDVSVRQQPNNPESYRQPMVTRPSFLQLVCQKPSQRSYMSNILLGIRRRLRQLADTHRLVDDVMGNNTMNVRSLTGRHASNKWFGNAAVATIRNIFRLTISRCHCLKRSRS